MSIVSPPARPPFACDVALQEALQRAGAQSLQPGLEAYAAALAEALQGDDTAWQAHRALGRRQGLVAQALTDDRPGRWSAWAAGLYLHAQMAPNSLDPLLQTASALAMLRQEPALWGGLGPLLRNPHDDPRDLPISQKTAIWIGLDARTLQVSPHAASIQARPVGMGLWGRQYLLSGDSPGLAAPHSDAHLLIAQTPQGPGCFFVPRWREDGQRNNLVVQPGHSSVDHSAAADLQLQSASAYLLGEEGAGPDAFGAAASVLHLGYTLTSCALLRQALVQAHAPRGQDTEPLMRSVLIDMALESEAALTLGMRLAQAFEACDTAAQDSAPALQRAWKHVMAPAAQFWLGRRAMEITGEAMEWAGTQDALDTPQGQSLARLFLAAPAQGRGEGAGNALCLQTLHALGQDKAAGGILFQAMEDIASGDPHILAQVHALRAMLAQPQAEQQAMARMLVQRLVLTAQACLLRRDAPPTVSQAFIASRLGHGGAGRVLGAIDTRHMDLERLLRRALA